MTNLTGHPAVTVPCGFTARRTPLGLGFIGRLYDEATILDVAWQYEQATAWRSITPQGVLDGP